MDKKQVKRIADVEAKKEVKAHESKMHKGAKHFRAGGKTNEEMKRLGRGLAKVANQKASVRKVRATGI